MLDDTLVVWGGEFGRTPLGEQRYVIGRDHQIDAYTVWLTGGGIRGGQVIGETDELGFRPARDSVSVQDVHATILRLLGLDHHQLTHRHNGRDFRLTDVSGDAIERIIV